MIYKKHMIKIILLIAIIIISTPLFLMKITCTGLWEKKVTKIPINLFGGNDNYTRCTYVGFSNMFKKIKDKKFEIDYKLVLKKDFISDTFPNMYFQYPVIDKFENIEQKCDADKCEFNIKNNENYTLVKVVISQANTEDFKDWFTVHGDLMGQHENKNGISYRNTNSDQNIEMLFLNQVKVFERGDTLSGVKFEIIYLPVYGSNDKDLEYIRNMWGVTVVDTLDFKNKLVFTQKKDTFNYKNQEPDFSFDYPDLGSLYKIIVNKNSIIYSVDAKPFEGPTGFSIVWEEIYAKKTEDYWDKQKVNKNNVKYVLDPDEKFLDFRLENQGGKEIRFDITLPGSYLRKKEIIQCLIDSFREI